MRIMAFILIPGMLLTSIVRGEDRPLSLAVVPETESVYALPQAPKADEGINSGGVNVDLGIRYMSANIYRGLDKFGPTDAKDSLNIQYDGKLTFDLGKAPHPFIGAFVNVNDSDPISRFQEIRPLFGAEWTIRPLIVSAGHISYILPEREKMNTSDIYGKIQIDDSYFLVTDKPILSPYVLASYDYDLNNGWYIEAGVKHDISIEDTGITLSFRAEVAYVIANQQFIAPHGRDTGFQHYQLGLTAGYSLNTLFNLPKRYGDFAIQGFLNYTDGLRDGLRADTKLWGGAGFAFRY